MRLLMTAGYDRALHAIALAELCVRDGHEVAGVLVVSPYSLARVRSLIRQRGKRFLVTAVRRMTGRTRGIPTEQAMERQLDELGIAHRSLRAWCNERGVPVHTLSSLDSPRAAEHARAANADAAVYAGGGILRKPFLDAIGGPVLNAHSGPLPAVRGMNACEWSLLLGHDPAVTIHMIDEGIDTGPILECTPVPTDSPHTLETLRGECIVRGVEGMRRAVAMLPLKATRPPQPKDTGRQCFVLAPVLRELAEQRIPRES